MKNSLKAVLFCSLLFFIVISCGGDSLDEIPEEEVAIEDFTNFKDE